MSNYRVTRADEESRYLSLSNSLVELDYEFRVLGLPSDSRDVLQALLERCRCDFRARFSR
jgi:hypothetical protein